ncbi:MAG: Hsp20/alpha crystallin family protein [Thermoplasmata archaeon]|nr:Hsp20/alpha crystallin family protein [Thermoplasmata archaeon]
MIRRRNGRDELAPVRYWETAWGNPLTLLNDMDRLFDEFKSEWEGMFVEPRGLGMTIVRQPLLDLVDDGEGYTLTAEMPGIRKEDLSIEVTDKSVEISGEIKHEEKEGDGERGYIRQERRYSRFYRAMPLPEDVAADKASADLKDGVLTIRLPKATHPEKKGRKIRVG